MTGPVIFQGIPSASTPIMNPDGTMHLAWYRFFMALQRKSGLAPGGPGVATDNRIGVDNSGNRVIGMTLYNGGPNVSVGYYTSGPPDYLINTLNIYDIQTGQFIAYINLTHWLGP